MTSRCQLKHFWVVLNLILQTHQASLAHNCSQVLRLPVIEPATLKTINLLYFRKDVQNLNGWDLQNFHRISSSVIDGSNISQVIAKFQSHCCRIVY